MTGRLSPHTSGGQPTEGISYWKGVVMAKSLMQKVKAKQSRRSTRSQAADARSTARKTASQSNKKGLKRWLKKPSKTDVSGVDTKGSGRTRKPR